MIAAGTRAGADARLPTVAEFVETIAGTFTAGTARTYRPYWRLAVGLFGDRRLNDVTIADLQAVVDQAVRRARRPSRTAPDALPRNSP